MYDVYFENVRCSNNFNNLNDYDWWITNTDLYLIWKQRCDHVRKVWRKLHSLRCNFLDNVTRYFPSVRNSPVDAQWRHFQHPQKLWFNVSQWLGRHSRFRTLTVHTYNFFFGNRAYCTFTGPWCGIADISMVVCLSVFLWTALKFEGKWTDARWLSFFIPQPRTICSTSILPSYLYTLRLKGIRCLYGKALSATHMDVHAHRIAAAVWHRLGFAVGRAVRGVFVSTLPLRCLILNRYLCCSLR